MNGLHHSFVLVSSWVGSSREDVGRVPRLCDIDGLFDQIDGPWVRLPFMRSAGIVQSR
jgi:hypothetical protein